jgi:hypothetical protein
MPPKEGIKGNWNYFWKTGGVDDDFLQERKEKLKLMLRRLVACEQVRDDETLQEFLRNEKFKIQDNNNGKPYLKALIGMKDMVLNNEIYEYGKACYNYYVTESKKEIDTKCMRRFKEIEGLINCIEVLNQYRLDINENFKKREAIMRESKVEAKESVCTKFDKVLEEAQVSCRELKQEFKRYQELKQKESWEDEFLKQKAGGRVQGEHWRTIERVTNTEKNLEVYIDKFQEKNQEMLKQLGAEMKEWRKNAHP